MSGLTRLSVDEGRLIMQLNLARDKCRVIANKINRYPTVPVIVLLMVFAITDQPVATDMLASLYGQVNRRRLRNQRSRPPVSTAK